MDLHKLFEQRIQQIEMLNDFVVLYGKKAEAAADMSQIKDTTNEVKLALLSCSQMLEQFRNSNRQRCNEIIETAKKQNLQILHILDELGDVQTVEAENGAPAPMETSSSSQPSLPLQEISNTPNKFTPSFKSGEPSIMSLDAYAKSPYTSKRLRPISLQFVDFDRTISAEEFSKIPSYLRGREALDDLLQFLENVIIRCFTAKYTLLPKRREAVAAIDMDLWNLYKQQEDYFKGCRFITQGDLCRLTGKQLEKKACGRISMLRHLKIIREERRKEVICYIWCNKN